MSDAGEPSTWVCIRCATELDPLALILCGACLEPLCSSECLDAHEPRCDERLPGGLRSS